MTVRLKQNCFISDLRGFSFRDGIFNCISCFQSKFFRLGSLSSTSRHPSGEQTMTRIPLFFLFLRHLDQKQPYKDYNLTFYGHITEMFCFILKTDELK